MDNYQQFIHASRYARWLPEEQRRETWEETVQRYIDNVVLPKVDTEVAAELKDAIIKMEVMPSMRALMTAGPALARDNVAGYNCAYLAIDRLRAFDELMYILLCGTGVGFSVERQYINKLPEVSEEFHATETTINVADSKIGWATAIRELIYLLYSGQIPKWDLSKVRPAGARLKTFGGRASGPEPLDRLFKRIVGVFTNAAGRKLNSIECHDLCCYIADAVVVGGVRRSALISLSNLTDERMRNAKSGEWWSTSDQRALANNSVAYTEKPDMGIFMREWESLYASRAGERGIFYRGAADRQAAKSGRREPYGHFGTNPCSEIILRDRQFCNLTEVVVRANDTYDDLARKVRLATILGTIQSTLTDFRYLSRKWRTNCEEERLLGVSLTGIMDHPFLNGRLDKDAMYSADFCGDEDATLEEVLQELKEEAITTNKEWANRLGINVSAAITCVKPSGTVSQLVGSSSGIHPAYDAFYLRAVRNSLNDPISQFMIAQGVPWEVDVRDSGTGVFYFPLKSAPDAVIRDKVSAIDQLKLWKVYQDNWCEHKPSCTIYVKDHEWLAVGAWVYENFDDVSGISFLPYSNHIYQQPPYSELTKAEYEEALAKQPEVDFTKFVGWESDDNTISSQEFACVGNNCEIV